MKRNFLYSLSAGVAAFAAACASAHGPSAFDSPDGAASADDGGTGLGDAASNGEVGFFSDGNSQNDTSVPGKTVLYAHDGTTLYSIDANDPKLAATKVGTFDCVGGTGQPSSMTDIAVDKDGKLYGVSTNTIFLDMQISGAAVRCATGAKAITATGPKVKFYGASFAPIGTLDPQRETLLVGNTDGELYKVDVTTGAITLVNSFGNAPAGNGVMYPGGAWEMSGDIVFLENHGNPIGFATVRDCQSPPSSSTCNPTDTLIQIDLAKFAQGPAGNGVSIRGPIVKAAGCADATPKYGSMFGIAAFQDKIIGFAHGGFTVSISNNDGSACLIAAAQPKWDGAGVTTKAPVIAPPPH